MAKAQATTGGPLSSTLAKINEKYGKGTILYCDEAKSLGTERIPTGIFELDMRIGGGVPRGRITIFSGGYSTGKTGLFYKTIANAQKMCRFCNDSLEKITPDGEVLTPTCSCKRCEPNRVVWADSEKSFDRDWAERWGVDVAKLVVVQTEYAEQCVDVGDAVIRSGEADVFVVDSVAAMTTKAEMEESAEKKFMGAGAALMAKALRKWTAGQNSHSLLVENKCTILLVNQLRMNIGGYVAFQDEPGGMALGFFASLRVRFKKQNEFLVEEGTGRRIGVDLEFDVKKNKTYPMCNPGNFKLYFVKRPGIEIGGTDTGSQILRAAIFWGLVKKSGSWVVFPDGKKIQGIDSAASVLEQDLAYQEQLKETVYRKEAEWMEGAPIGGADEKEGDPAVE